MRRGKAIRRDPGVPSLVMILSPLLLAAISACGGSQPDATPETTTTVVDKPTRITSKGTGSESTESNKASQEASASSDSEEKADLTWSEAKVNVAIDKADRKIDDFQKKLDDTFIAFEKVMKELDDVSNDLPMKRKDEADAERYVRLASDVGRTSTADGWKKSLSARQRAVQATKEAREEKQKTALDLAIQVSQYTVEMEKWKQRREMLRLLKKIIGTSWENSLPATPKDG